MYEYLAAGRPVVSKSTPSALRFAPLVRIASDAQSFEAAIAQALAEDGSLVPQRMVAVKNHTWEHRVALIGSIVERSLSSAVRPAHTADAASHRSLA
jgi:hypothetical protein